AASVLQAFLEEGIDDSELAGTTGYGYDDAARARYESLLARVFGTERALARISMVSGTHAIVNALAACTPPGSTLVSISGRPYDTLRNAICDAPYALVTQGITYEEVPLKNGTEIDLPAVRAAVERANVSTVFVQRSRGYAPRRSLSIAQCEAAFASIRT